METINVISFPNPSANTPGVIGHMIADGMLSKTQGDE